jgi:hypothetical protein
MRGKLMKVNCYLLCLVAFTLFFACSEKTTYHKAQMPDPKSFNAHFGDMDSNDDGLVSRDEFNAYFPKAETTVFDSIDLNADNALDHDEWHKFKAAHGLKHQD